MNWLRLPILAKEIMAINYWAEFEYGEYYHLYNRSAGREPIFQYEQWVNFFQEKWEKLSLLNSPVTATTHQNCRKCSVLMAHPSTHQMSR